MIRKMRITITHSFTGCCKVLNKLLIANDNKLTGFVLLDQLRYSFEKNNVVAINLLLDRE